VTPSVPLGDDRVEVELQECDVTIAEPPGGDPVEPGAAAERAISNPRGPRVSEIANSDDDVAIVVTDVTRATPDAALLDPMVAELADAGVDRSAITVVVGLGLHRPMDDEEIRAALGEYADLVVNHDPEATVQVGVIDGCPIEVNEVVADADLVCSTGMVEPHQYAGFSGGAKTAVIGAGGEAQIRYTHGPDMLANDGARLGRVADNPFRDFLDRAGDVADLDFVCNVTHGPSGILDAAAGEPRAVVRDLAASARDALAVPVDREYDAVVAGVPPAKAASLYQASRGATNVVLGARNPLGAGGRVVVPARLGEGAGQGTGERRFARWLREAEDAGALFEAMQGGYEPGAQRAFVLARALRDHDVWVTNSEHPSLVEDCLLNAASDPRHAVESGSDVLVVPDALSTLLV